MEEWQESFCGAQVVALVVASLLTKGELILRRPGCDAREMMSMKKVFAGLLVGLSCGGMWAQEQGNWRPVSTTARAIMGPIAIGDEKLVINFVRFPVAEIRTVTPAEIAAVLAMDPTESGKPLAGHLFRLSIAADQKFLHKNTMCGGDETQWMVSAVQGKTLQLAFFSGATMPVLTAEAVGNSTSLCGTFTFTR